MNDELNILKLSIKDFFSSKMLIFSILPFVITIVLMYIIFFIIAGITLESFSYMDIYTTHTSIENGITHTETTNTNLQSTSIFDWLMSFAFVSAIVSSFLSFSIYAIGGVLTLYLSIVIAIVIIGFLTPYILKEIQKKHYPDIEMPGHSNSMLAIIQTIKWLFIMMFLFFLFIPLYFVPFVQIIAFNFPLYYFFHKLLTYDVASNIVTKEQNHQIKFKNANKF